MSKSNALSVTNYTDGVTTEAYTFEHEATEQTPALTDYRYIGASPNNYIEFNCDDNGENCEVWRAIGVFKVDDGNNNWEWRIKLVRESALPDAMAWDSSGSNDWTTASLKNTLNGTYLNSLSTSAKSLIEDAKYYLGGVSYDLNNFTYGTTEEIYFKERCNTLCESCDNNAKKVNLIEKVGLIYPSDLFMVYVDKIVDVCFNNPSDCYEKNYQPWNGQYVVRDNPGYPQTGWIYNSLKIYFWLLSSMADENLDGGSSTVFRVKSDGSLNWMQPTAKFGIRPVLYLSSSVKTTSGDGSVDSPYKLSL